MGRQLTRQWPETPQAKLSKSIISCGRDINWPTYFPYLKSLDLFPWIYFKENVYVNKPHALQWLKGQLRTEIGVLKSKKVLERVRIREAENKRFIKDELFNN